LVLYAFDIVHTDPTDLFDVGLGFNRGIKDNDRSRKRDQPFPGGDGAAATAEGLGEAADFLRSASKGDLDAILLSAGDDAHKRLFPFDPFGGSSGEGGGHQRRTQRLTEQHLLLLQEGGAEAYLASKSAAVREKAAAAAAGGGAAKGGKRRRQRQQAVGGEGEYSVSSDGSTSADGGASRIQHGALKGDNERENAEYYDEAVSARRRIVLLIGSLNTW
jgi:acetoin utilization deacetylase AcuC-like enzyme